MLNSLIAPIPGRPDTPAPMQPAAPAAGQTSPSEFADVLAGFARQAIDTLRHGEAAAAGGLAGQLPIQEVVGKVMAAEQALQTGIALRDKIVAAYLEINRMTI